MKILCIIRMRNILHRRDIIMLKKLICVMICLLTFASYGFAQTKKTVQDSTPIFSSDFIDTVDISKLYAVNGTGQYKGKKLLKGFKGHSKCIISFTGKYNSYSGSVEIKGKTYSNMQEKISWTNVEGVKLKSTRGEFYEYLDVAIPFYDKLRNHNEYTYSQEWFNDKYGKLYEDYFRYNYEIETGTELLELYMESIDPTPKVDRFSTRDIDMSFFDKKEEPIDLDGIR